MLKTVMRFPLAAVLLGAGVMHFVDPWFFVQIMPPYLPWHWELVYLSGVIEIALGVALLVPATQRLAAWGALALFVAVFPANVHMAMANVQFDPPPAMGQPSQAAAWGRLPLQLVLILWAWWLARDDRGNGRLELPR
ncbi:MAG: DoxX family protein [Deltaproteobacteria bacterium]|nr:DoxX family protein [Deltaproteobacteria bacterium]